MNFYHLYIGDSREVLKKIPQIVKLTVTSPPYAWEFRYEGKEKQLGEIWDTKKFFQELHRVW
ncbi:MAG: site-specific DNA-methyltransferase, partial [Candidatus Hecatellales archaeon]